MPRKQRFKPSRKPKPPQSAEITEIQPTSHPVQTEVEHAQPARTPQDQTSVIEESDNDSHRA
jgi:hypothetical protein